MSDSVRDNRAPLTVLGTAQGRYVAFAIAWYIVFVVLPSSLAGPWYLAFGIVTLVVASRHLRTQAPKIRRATSLIVAAGVVSLTGAAIRGIHSIVSGLADPFPSPAEVFSLLSYVLLIGAIIYIVLQRNPRLGVDPILDATVGGIAVGVLQWSLVMIPYLESVNWRIDTSVVVNIVYAIVSLMLIVAAVMALVAGSTPSTSNRLLALGLVSTAAVDVIYTLAGTGRIPNGLQLYVSPLVLIFSAAGLLHPSLNQLLDRPTDLAAARRVSQRRTVVLSLALLTPPLLLVWGVVTGRTGVALMLPAVGSVALAPLVILRLGRLVGQNHELASTEASLRSVGERLVSAETDADVADIIITGAQEILGDRLIRGAFVLDPATAAAAATHEFRHELDAVRESFGTIDSEDTELVIVPTAAADGHVAVGLVTLQQELRASLILVTTRQLSDEEQSAVLALCRESSIALRAVERTEQQVRQRSEDRFAALIDNSSDIVAVLDSELRISYVSPVASRLLGYPDDHFYNESSLALVHPDDFSIGAGIVDEIVAGHSEPIELRLRHFLGTYHWFEVVGVDLTDDPNIAGYLLNLREISDRKLAEEQLVLSEARFKALVQHSTDMVVVLDHSGMIRYASPSIQEVLGTHPDDLVGTAVGAAFTDSDLDWDAELKNRTGVAHPQLVEFTFRSGDDVRTVETSITDLRSEPAVGGYVLNARDVTERKSMEHRLRYQATHDELTGLANRPHVVDDLDGILRRNSGSTTVAAIAVGLDDFKDVNDSLGHAFGDQLLIAVAERLKGLLSFGDVAARVGGDEFVVVVERSHGESHVAELAERILSAIGLPYVIDGRELTITASAGIVFDHDRSSTGEILLRNADTAMYRSKSLGKRQVIVFEPQMHAASYDRLELRADLARAIAGNQFIAHYQPIVDIHTRRIVGAEALIRWDHPTRGMLGPNLFIPLAEESGMIGALGEWILRRACTDVASWRRQFGKLIEDFTISVNLSVHQLHDEYIVGTVAEILAYADLPADRLVLEVTESTLITDNDRTSGIMSQLRGLGARLAVDDFGTGYSSLGYIQQFEFDVLKIDKSFVDALDTTTNQRIVTAVIDLARQLGVRTVAEGIEIEQNVETLQRLGCDLGQGYLFSRPVSEAAFRELFAADRAEQVLPPGEEHAKLN